MLTKVPDIFGIMLNVLDYFDKVVRVSACFCELVGRYKDIHYQNTHELWKVDLSVSA